MAEKKEEKPKEEKSKKMSHKQVHQLAKEATKKAKEAKKGKHIIRKYKVRRNVTFRRPKTQSKNLKPLVVKTASKKYDNYDDYAIIKHPLASETAMKQIESNNTLTFIVDIKSNKRQIKKACEKLYKIKVRNVNTLIRPDGVKKAYVKVSRDQEALDVANKIGFM